MPKIKTKHVQDQFFKAIVYVRSRGLAERKLQRDFAAAEDQAFERFSVRDSPGSNKLTPKGLIDIRDDQLGPKDHKHEELLAREFIAAVREGNIDRLKEIVALCNTFEKSYGRTIKVQNDHEHPAVRSGDKLLCQTEKQERP